MSVPEKEHEWLQQFVGEWEVVNTGAVDLEQPTMDTKGTLNSKMLGGFWVIKEINVDVRKIAVKGIQTFGYNPERKSRSARGAIR